MSTGCKAFERRNSLLTKGWLSKTAQLVHFHFLYHLVNKSFHRLLLVWLNFWRRKNNCTTTEIWFYLVGCCKKISFVYFILYSCLKGFLRVPIYYQPWKIILSPILALVLTKKWKISHSSVAFCAVGCNHESWSL